MFKNEQKNYVQNEDDNELVTSIDKIQEYLSSQEDTESVGSLDAHRRATFDSKKEDLSTARAAEKNVSSRRKSLGTKQQKS